MSKNTLKQKQHSGVVAVSVFLSRQGGIFSVVEVSVKIWKLPTLEGGGAPSQLRTEKSGSD